MNTLKTARPATRRGLRTLASAASLALALLGPSGLTWAETVVAESSFTTGNDGWGIGTLFATEVITTPVQWQATGGDPGGYISNSVKWTHIAFEAPAYFLGDRSALFGEGYIRFDRWADIEVPGASSGGEVMLVISNGRLNLQFVAGAPGPSWSDGNQIVFDATHGWEVSPTTFEEQGGHGVPATNEQMLSVLSNLTAIRFPARFTELGSATGTVALDSVQLISSVPEPHAAWLLVAGIAALALRARRRGLAAALFGSLGLAQAQQVVGDDACPYYAADIAAFATCEGDRVVRPASAEHHNRDGAPRATPSAAAAAPVAVTARRQAWPVSPQPAPQRAWMRRPG